MDLLDDNILAEVVDDTAASDRLGTDDKEFLKSLETMAAEIESEADNSN
jgi:hypothetical protein